MKLSIDNKGTKDFLISEEKNERKKSKALKGLKIVPSKNLWSFI